MTTLRHRVRVRDHAGYGDERIALPARKAKVACVALNTASIESDEAARRAIAEVAEETGLPADDPVRFGAQHLLDALLARL